MDADTIAGLERAYFLKYDELAEEKRGVTEGAASYGARMQHAITRGTPMQDLPTPEEDVFI